jgi:hypothetical protein
VLVAAFTALTPLVSEAGVAATIVVIAPTLAAGVLSVRAASDIAAQLTQPLRLLLALVALLALATAVGLALQPAPAEGSRPPDLHSLKVSWIVIGVLLMVVSAVLLSGWLRLTALLRYRDKLPKGPNMAVGSGDALMPCARSGHPGVLSCSPRIPPPDCWIETGEGDRVPWGWLWVAPGSTFCIEDGQRRDGHGRGEDERYWNATHPLGSRLDRQKLVKWRENLFLEQSQ